MSSDILKTLHPYEIAILNVLRKKTSAKDLAELTDLKEIQVGRALQWLSNKQLISEESHEEKVVLLDANGISYQKQGLPENNFLRSLSEKFISVRNIAKKAKVSEDEINIIIGTLKKKLAIDITKENGELQAKITAQGKKLLEKPTFEELFLQKKFPVSLTSLSPDEQFTFQSLKSRKKIVLIEDKKTIVVQITSEGARIQKELAAKDVKLVDQLTQQHLKTGDWKKLDYRYYDIDSPLPKLYGGKRHFVNQAIEYMKQIWVELGFQEMEGTFCQTAFWDLDALFVPQDHPARQMQDTFFIADAKNTKKIFKGSVPALHKNVKAVHENGGDTGSKGWGGSWSKYTASEIMLRTHTTALSAQYINDRLEKDAKGNILPGKFFSVNKVFRNEAVDWKHLFEFNQVEGIVIDPNATFQDLVGYLKLFFKKMGFADVRVKPSHFPYTEPSAEVEVFNQRKGEWIELGGSGIFRPEVTKTLIGEEVPVLAWGLGMERIIVEYFDLHDLRDLYKNDIKQLKEMKAWMKVSE
jgi:phenylalanyl-tRNA synthetase alpha chain